ncbi:MAG TPA: glycosyltransferase family 2 protein [Leptolyngbyaceae cyanobacterium]
MTVVSVFSALEPPKVAVVVPTRNRKDKTLRFLEQMASQTYPTAHAIVVDASSSDGTVEQVNQQFPNAVVLKVDDSCFWAGSTNAGVRYALSNRFDYILTINDDSVITPTHIETLLQLAMRHACSILGNQINYLNQPDRIWSLGAYTAWGTQNFLRLNYCDTLQQELPDSLLQQDVLETDALPGNGVLIHRSVFEKIGLYNDVFLPHYHADSEWVMRAKQKGFQPYVTPKVTLLNDFSIEQKSLSFRPLLSRRTGILYTFFHKKSHLFLPALLYIFFRYCPLRFQVRTLGALSNRLLKMAFG